MPTETTDADVEDIFGRALALPVGERLAFVREEAKDRPAVLNEVEMLLQGLAESGGEDALPTLGDAPSARAEWVIASAEEPGMMIDHFRLIRKIGEGGMGTVWEADQIRPLKRKVALKVVKLGMDTLEVVQRFEQERQILATLKHPNIASVYEAGATAMGRPYFAMEFVPGQVITRHCQEEELPLPDRLTLMLDVCAAIHHAHQAGVVHRDLKPTNILVAEGAVKVIDFGVSKATTNVGCDHTLLTHEARVLGTLAYMSPEQAIGSADSEITAASDVYSLGVVLYELATGELPIEAKRLETATVVERQRILIEEDPRAPSTVLKTRRKHEPIEATPAPNATGFRKDFDRIVLKALEKEPERRYPDAISLADDLRRFVEKKPVLAGSPSKIYRWSRTLRRQSPVVLAASGILALSAMVALAWLVSLIPTPQTPHVVTSLETAGPGSLRDLIETAASGERIEFEPGLAGQTITLDGRPLIIDRAVTIDASDLEGGMTIDANKRSAVLLVEQGTVGQVTLRSLTIANGLATEGAGIDSSGDLLVEDCHFSRNQAQTGVGGAIRHSRGKLTIRRSSFRSNVTQLRGGGLAVSRGDLALENSTFFENSANQEGGAIYLYRSTSALTHNTIVGNRALNGGGLSCREAITSHLANNLIVGNHGTSSPDILSFQGELISSGLNLLGEPSGSELADRFEIVKDARLGDYGTHRGDGPSKTLALLPGSPAIDAAPDSDTRIDQRGTRRDSKPDVGAFEFTPLDPVAPAVSNKIDLSAATAKQSSEVVGGGERFAAWKAIDGDLTSTSHTRRTDYQPWLEIDLASDQRFGSLRLHNRDIEQEHFCDLVLEIFDASGATLYQSDPLNPGDVLNGPEFIDIKLPEDLLARRIRLSRVAPPETEYPRLSLAELELFAPSSP